MKTILRLLLPALFLPVFGQASHLMGGEISWLCQPNGQFVFTMTIYRDCNGINMGFSPLILQSNTPAGNIPMNFIDTNDVSPICNPSPSEPHLFCSTADGDDTGSIQEFIFRSNPVTLNGVPPAGGWEFYWESCCRNAAIGNLAGAGGQGYRIRAKMYAYLGRNTFPCFDSSPTFLEKPMVTCTGYPFAFSGAGVDGEQDSTNYAWDQPLTTGGTPCNFSSGYSFSSPLPGPSQDPNNTPTILNSVTGEISATIFTSGSYVVCHKISEYRCGELIGEIFRDVPVILRACRPIIPNPTPPLYNNPPMFDSAWVPQMMADTIYAGDTVSFSIGLQDFDLDPSLNFQQLHLDAMGAQFSSDFTNTNACLYPPCATINPNPQTTTGLGVLNFTFNWVTSCSHLQSDTACSPPAIYPFVFRAFDDFCPIPGRTLYTYTVVVLPSPGTPQHPVVTSSGDTLFCSSTAQGYQWYLNDTAITGATAAFYVPIVAGMYSVEVFGGCGGHSQSFQFTPVGIRDLDFLAHATVFPNPVQTTFRLEAFTSYPVPTTVTLLDGPGRILQSWNLPGSRNVHLDVDMNSFPAGCYFIRLNTPTVQRTFRIIKMK